MRCFPSVSSFDGLRLNGDARPPGGASDKICGRNVIKRVIIAVSSDPTMTHAKTGSIRSAPIALVDCRFF